MFTLLGNKEKRREYSAGESVLKTCSSSLQEKSPPKWFEQSIAYCSPGERSPLGNSYFFGGF